MSISIESKALKSAEITKTTNDIRYHVFELMSGLDVQTSNDNLIKLCDVISNLEMISSLKNQIIQKNRCNMDG